MSSRLAIEVLGEGLHAQLPERGRLVVGADSTKADLVVPGQGVAGVHCAIGRVKGGGWALKDLGSEYGTIVNGERVATARLAAGDSVVLGSKRLLVYDPAAPPTPQPQKPQPPQSPQQSPLQAAPQATFDVPGFALQHRLGRGGMGEVWLANQVSLDRQVALKVLSRKLEADTAFVERFQAEARAAAALNHPNVVTVYDVGQRSGHHYLAMEYMAGGCLESRLAARGPVPWREALAILHDAAKGLEYAESRGVVHRDIKPANLMLTADGITKICDLGLAVQVEQEEVQGESGKIYGTPHFIAPELVRGGRPDSRSDLYSLGATAYRILSGRTPFEGETTREILRGVLHDEPEALDELVPGLPADVARMVERLLEKDPAARFPSARVLVQELERLRSGAAGPVAPAPRQRSKLVVAAVGAGVLAIAGFGVRSIFGDGSAPAPDPDRSSGADESLVAAGGPVAAAPGTELAGPADGDPDGASGEPSEDDRDERLFELQAQNALLELSSRVLPDEQRVAALRELAAAHRGTDAAREAGSQADALAAKIASARAAAERKDAALEALAANLRAAAELGDPPRPGDALRAMRAVPGQEVWANDAEFRSLRADLERAVLDRTVEWAEATWERMQAHEREGDFDELTALSGSLTALLDLPDFEDGEPPQVERLRALAAGARAKRDNLSDLRAEYLVKRTVADRLALAAGLGGPPGLESDLRDLELSAAVERLRATLASLGTDDARARIEPLVDDVERARAVLATLAAAWEAGEWKRLTVLDPRGGNGETAGVDGRGILLGTGSTPELVPWSAWGRDAEAIDNLFTARLQRDWTPEELRGIAALTRIAAVISAVDRLGAVLRAGGDREPDPKLLEEVRGDFDSAREWAREAGESAAIAAEREASDVLVLALEAGAAGRWSLAVASTERLLRDHGDTLFVLLLSDGSDWRERAAPAATSSGGGPGEDEDEREDDDAPGGGN